MLNIRFYNSTIDYPAVKSLYSDSSTYGGQFDEARDSENRLRTLIEQKPEAILVAENDSNIVGTVTIFEDGRSVWLYRFAVKNQDMEVNKILWDYVKEICKRLGHTQVLVYAPEGNDAFEERYTKLGFTKGGNFTAYWQDL
jgi:ribosomal protein S18 acetylase RimI-like enzyme